MRPGLCFLAAFLIASPAMAQSVTLPIERAQARTLSKEALAQLMFGATADQVVAADAEAVYLGDTIAQVTFLLRPHPAVEDYMTRYDGACSIRRVRVTLDMADGGRTVDDITTDTVWAVLGPLSVVESDLGLAPGEEDPAAANRKAACDRWNDFRTVVEAPNLMTLMAATDTLAALPALLDRGGVGVTCDGDAACGEPHRTALRTGRLTEVGQCDDPELMESLGIREDQTCLVLTFILPGDTRFQFDSLRIVAAGDWHYPERFVPSRISMGVGTTIVD